MSYPATTVNVPDYTPGQTLGVGGTDHGTMHDVIALEVNAIAVNAAKATRGGEEFIRNVGNVATAHTIDLSYGNVHRITMTGNIVLTYPSAASIPDGRAVSFMLELTQDGTGSKVVTWPASIRWLTGVPTLAAAAGKRNLLSFTSIDDGATWFGSFIGSA